MTTMSAKKATEQETDRSIEILYVGKKPPSSFSLSPPSLFPPDSEPIYTHRLFHLAGRLPLFLQKILGGTVSVLHVEEKAVIAYPYIYTEYTLPAIFSEKRFKMVVTSQHAPKKGGMYQHNIFKLSRKEIEERAVRILDIVTDPLPKSKSSPDLRNFSSEKVPIKKLRAGWKGEMVAYKMVKIHIGLPIGTRLRRKASEFANQIISEVYLDVHRHCIAEVDEWYDMDISAVLKLVEEVQQTLSLHEKNQTHQRKREGAGGGKREGAGGGKREGAGGNPPVIRSRL
mmetsp:Transcript_33863/g.46350  ORF Transcript_33863/g.46350 Transcript_33863/m.46350 type:complete len:285 (+) Transcript_33863:80-934(+)